MNSPLLYRTKSNIQSSYSVKEKYEEDYKELRHLLTKNNISVGDFIVKSYKEFYQGQSADAMLKAIRWAR